MGITVDLLKMHSIVEEKETLHSDLHRILSILVWRWSIIWGLRDTRLRGAYRAVVITLIVVLRNLSKRIGPAKSKVQYRFSGTGQDDS